MLYIAWWVWPQEFIEDNMDWFYKPINEFLQKFDPAGEEQP